MGDPQGDLRPGTPILVGFFTEISKKMGFGQQVLKDFLLRGTPYGGGLIKYTVLIKYTGVIKYTARKPILSVEICEIKYTVFVYIFLSKKILRRFLHKKSNFFFFFLISVVRILYML